MMISNKNISDHLFSVIKTFLKSWLEYKQSLYLIKICSLCMEEKTNLLIVKYQFANKRVYSEMPLKEFIESPLIHLVHPTQLYYLGFDTSELISKQRDNQVHPNLIQKTVSRFKRLFK